MTFLIDEQYSLFQRNSPLADFAEGMRRQRLHPRLEFAGGMRFS
jgi:hypothetical protein